MLSFECIKNEKSVYFLLTSATSIHFGTFEAYSAHMPKISSPASQTFL